MFGHQNPGLGTGSGSALKKNAGSGSALNECGFTTLCNSAINWCSVSDTYSPSTHTHQNKGHSNHVCNSTVQCFGSALNQIRSGSIRIKILESHKHFQISFVYRTVSNRNSKAIKVKRSWKKLQMQRQKERDRNKRNKNIKLLLSCMSLLNSSQNSTGYIQTGGFSPCTLFPDLLPPNPLADLLTIYLHISTGPPSALSSAGGSGG